MAELPIDMIFHYHSDDGITIKVDAIPLVRCKDCIHCFVAGENVRFNVCELNYNKAQSNDWFCADGKRKESDDE